MPSNGVLITRSNIHELTSDDILSFNSKEYWHKFILGNGGLFEKEAILQAVLESITPFDLVPVKYTVEGRDAYFLARNCGQAVEKFCLNLLLPIQLKDPPGEVSISIQTCSVSMNQYKINMQHHLKNAIEKRYDSQNGFVNLSSFHKEPELYEILFCPLSKPKFLAYVLSILKKILTVRALDLSNNSIEILKPLEVLQEIEGLVSVNLSYNKIWDSSLPEVLQKAVPSLQELNLTGNPVCSLFETEVGYLKWILTKNCHVKKLDGLPLFNGYPNQQVYLCSDSAWEIVDAFLYHYFTLFDENRQALEHTYEKNAIFSLTFTNLPSSDSNGSKLEGMKFEINNLLKTAGKSKMSPTHHCKNTKIINFLTQLPSTEHYPYSFKVDVLFHQEPIIIIIVSGIFKDFLDIPRVRSFNRTFVLKRVAVDEFKITNDLFHVIDATDDEINASFQHVKQRKQTTKTGSLLTQEEEENLIGAMCKLTEMNHSFSKKCLIDCDWDFKKSLEVFLENYEVFNIPLEAFTEEFPSQMTAG